MSVYLSDKSGAVFMSLDHGGNDDDDDDEDDDGAIDVLLARGLRSGFAVLLACSGSREGRLLWTALPSRPRNSLGMALAELLRGEEGGSRAVSSRVVALALGKMGARYAKLPNQLRQALEKGLSYSTDDRDEILALLAWPSSSSISHPSLRSPPPSYWRVYRRRVQHSLPLWGFGVAVLK